MILRRLAEAFWKQDWIAVFLEVLIVVVGIFVGLQVNDWNEDRKAKNEEIVYLERIVEDFGISIRETNESIEFQARHARRAAIVLDALNACDIPVEAQLDFANGIYHLGKISPVEFARTTIDELRSAGRFAILRNAELRRQVSQMVQDYEDHRAFFDDLQGRLAPQVNYVDSRIALLIRGPVGGGAEIAWHSHPDGQLIYAAIGSMSVHTEDGLFIVPLLMAVWVAPAVAHAITMHNRVAKRTLYFRSDALPLPDQSFGVLRVSPLLRELILARVAEDSIERPRAEALDILTTHEIQTAGFEPLALKAPSDGRVRRIVTTILERPVDSRSLVEWSCTVGASPRTIERIFLRETHLTFRQWRQQARLLKAVLFLSEGRSITELASDVGYASQSAFTYMFRRQLGVAPRDYFKAVENRRRRLPIR